MATACWAVGRLVTGFEHAELQGLVDLLDQLQVATPEAVSSVGCNAM